MAAVQTSKRKTHVPTERPPFERVALILQGGGALGAYQAGVYQALAEANLHPDWVAGISIGAVNSALIAGNPPEKRVEQLRAFWETVSQPPFGVPTLPGVDIHGEYMHAAVNQMRSLGILLGGAPGFFTPRVPPPYLQPPGSAAAVSFYDVAPSRPRSSAWWTSTSSMPARCVSASARSTSAPAISSISTAPRMRSVRQHVMASGSLPPGFPATEIEGEHYWDGGLVSNTPLEWVLESSPRQDTLAFQIDLWSASGEYPRNLDRVRGAPEGHPLFQPHQSGDRSFQEESSCSVVRPPNSSQRSRETYGKLPRRKPSPGKPTRKSII